ncbi:hypothetical protein [Streptomyces swartbergensis]|uniref:Uncharacterized protein n=1 Tax=Streptomyces swartbergensis TaxID=487165 RepID=A0A243S7V5_9ACTN|nr:hypothetical protein [Streptomyces swartbergensis]OUD03367.1 hypothetical protein CA983_10175 [Streptomyces swartbergensis]
MSDNPTRVLNALLALSDNPDDIRLDEQDGRTFIVLGSISIVVSTSSQAAIDKLATVAAQAAADSRARRLREVA